jgi:hypothetical protein
MIVHGILLAATSAGVAAPLAFSKAQRIAVNIAKLPELLGVQRDAGTARE